SDSETVFDYLFGEYASDFSWIDKVGNAYRKSS
ncbi:transposase, partial [Streptococcus suis]